MKKIIIAGASLAALGLAVLPMPGVFADVTDTVQVTINANCSVGGPASSTDATGNSFSGTVANGGVKEWAPAASTGGTIKVTCNNANGWHIKAVGSQSGTATAMAGTNGSIATGTVPTSGGTSYWGMKLASSTSGVTLVSGYSGTNYVAVPGTATKVASGSAAISEGVIYTGYKVYASPTQPAGTYTGKVTYTVATGTGS